jgi:hypothetical protein
MRRARLSISSSVPPRGTLVTVCLRSRREAQLFQPTSQHDVLLSRGDVPRGTCSLAARLPARFETFASRGSVPRGLQQHRQARSQIALELG